MLNLNAKLFHSKFNYTSAVLYFQFNYMLFLAVILKTTEAIRSNPAKVF